MAAVAIVVSNQFELDHVLRADKDFIVLRMKRICLDHSRGFVKLCKMLETGLEDIRTFAIDFNWLEHKQVLLDLHKLNKSINHLRLGICDRMTGQDLNDISAVIMAHKTIKRLTYKRIRSAYGTVEISAFAKLLLASKIPDHVAFGIDIDTFDDESDDLEPEPVFEDSDLKILLDLVTATKCYKLRIRTQIRFNLDLKALADYILDGHAPTLTALNINDYCHDTTSEHWIRLLHHATTLRSFKISGRQAYTIKGFESEYFRALENCRVRTLAISNIADDELQNGQNFYELIYKALKNNKFVEKLLLNRCQEDTENVKFIGDLLKENNTINYFGIYTSESSYSPQYNAKWHDVDTTPGSVLIEALKTNQSVIDINANEELIGYDQYCTLEELMQRNQRQQNTAVHKVIATIYNLARDENSLGMIPREIWAMIFSNIRISGVALDFASIIDSIFADHSIRRVIPRSRLRGF